MPALACWTLVRLRWRMVLRRRLQMNQFRSRLQNVIMPTDMTNQGMYRDTRIETHTVMFTATTRAFNTVFCWKKTRRAQDRVSTFIAQTKR